MIELTEHQRQAVKEGEAIRIALPDIGQDVVILSAEQFQLMQAELNDKHEQEAVLRYSMKQATKVAKDNPF